MTIYLSVIEGDWCPNCREGKMELLTPNDEKTFATYLICKRCGTILPRKDVWKIKIGQL